MCGIIITTTGFSGRLIAGSSSLAQICIIAGVSLTLLAAAIVVVGVQHLRWLTQQPGEALEPWLLACLQYRDRKTRFYRLGIWMLLAGLVFYVAAIALMLMNPQAGPAGPIR